MSRIIKDPFLEILPSIDVHGETTETVRFVINDFINDNYKLKNPEVLIIHGKGSGRLRKAVHEELKRNKYILSFFIYNMNEGCTIAKIKLDK